MNAPSIIYETPLILAIRHGFTKCIDILLENGADVNAHTKNSTYILHMVAEKGDISLLEKLVEKGNNLDLNPRDNKNSTPLQLAIENDHPELATKLIQLGADINTQDNDGNSPLYTCAARNDLTNLLLLLGKGADPNCVNEVNISEFFLLLLLFDYLFLLKFF